MLPLRTPVYPSSTYSHPNSLSDKTFETRHHAQDLHYVQTASHSRTDMTRGGALCTSVLSRLASGSESYLCSSLPQPDFPSTCKCERVGVGDTGERRSPTFHGVFEDCFESSFLPEVHSPRSALGSFAAAITAPQFLGHDTVDGLDGQRHVCLT
jgi:hypothetical protein